jgi:hypothetical protein
VDITSPAERGSFLGAVAFGCVAPQASIFNIGIAC